MNNIEFIKQFIKNPGNIGAIAVSSRRLAKKMVETVDFKNCECIVEFGPGTGVFTGEILKNIRGNTKVLVFEINKEFYKGLVNKYGNVKNVHILNASAEDIEVYLNKFGLKKADYIVSGIPFKSIPPEVASRILSKTSNVLEHKGEFITFQYITTNKKLFNKYFGNITSGFELFNIFPAHVVRCKKPISNY